MYVHIFVTVIRTYVLQSPVCNWPVHEYSILQAFAIMKCSNAVNHMYLRTYMQHVLLPCFKSMLEFAPASAMFFAHFLSDALLVSGASHVALCVCIHLY